MLRFDRSADLRVMLAMAFCKSTAGTMKQPAVVGIFDAVCPHQAENKASQRPLPTCWRVEGNQNGGEYSRNNGCDGVVAFLRLPVMYCKISKFR